MIDDPVKYLLDNPDAQAVIIEDPRNSYKRPVFQSDTQEKVETALTKEIRATLDDYEKRVWPQTLRNFKTFEGQSEGGETITIPIARRDTNQHHAWLINSIFSKNPTAKCRAIGGGELEYLLEVEVEQPDPMTGQVRKIRIPTESKADTFEFAENFTKFLQYRLSEKVPFRQVTSAYVLDALADGTTAALLKNIHERAERTVTQHGLEEYEEEGQKKIRLSQESKEVLDGEPNQIIHVRKFDFIMPLDEQDLQKARWCAQKFELNDSRLREKIDAGEYDFCRPPDAERDGDYDRLVELVTSKPSKAEKSKFEPSEIDKRVASEPEKRHRIWEVWFFWPLQDEAGDITIYSLCANLHEKSGKFLNCYVNWLWTGERPYEPLFMNERTYSFSGGSITENALPFQRLISLIFHGQLQNMAVCNVAIGLIRQNSSSWKFFNPTGSAKVKLRPGLIVPIDEDGDVQFKPLGTALNSMAPEIAFLNREDEKINVLTPTDQGILQTHVPAASVAQMQASAKAQPTLFLEVVRGALSRVIKRYVQIEAQFSPYGVVIPFHDPKQKAMIDRIIHFPKEIITDQFAFYITATADDQTKDAEYERSVLHMKHIEGANAQALELGRIIFDKLAPPPARKFAAFLLVRYEKMLRRALATTVMDADAFTMEEDELQSLVQQFGLWEVQEQMKMMEGARNVPGAGGGQVVSPNFGGPQGAGGVEAQPGVALAPQ